MIIKKYKLFESSKPGTPIDKTDEFLSLINDLVLDLKDDFEVSTKGYTSYGNPDQLTYDIIIHGVNSSTIPISPFSKSSIGSNIDKASFLSEISKPRGEYNKLCDLTTELVQRLLDSGNIYLNSYEVKFADNNKSLYKTITAPYAFIRLFKSKNGSSVDTSE